MNIDEIVAENERLKKEITDLEVQIRAAETTIRRARDVSPIERPSLKRVLKLAQDACLAVQRVRGGWMLKLGNLARRFKRLSQIWELLITDNWILSELFHAVLPVRVPKILKGFSGQSICPETSRPKPTLRNPCIAPSYGNSDKTFVPSTE